MDLFRKAAEMIEVLGEDNERLRSEMTRIESLTSSGIVKKAMLGSLKNEELDDLKDAIKESETANDLSLGKTAGEGKRHTAEDLFDEFVLS